MDILLVYSAMHKFRNKHKLATNSITTDDELSLIFYTEYSSTDTVFIKLTKTLITQEYYPQTLDFRLVSYIIKP